MCVFMKSILYEENIIKRYIVVSMSSELNSLASILLVVDDLE